MKWSYSVISLVEWDLKTSLNIRSDYEYRPAKIELGALVYGNSDGPMRKAGMAVFIFFKRDVVKLMLHVKFKFKAMRHVVRNKIISRFLT